MYKFQFMTEEEKASHDVFKNNSAAMNFIRSEGTNDAEPTSIDDWRANYKRFLQENAGMMTKVCREIGEGKR